MTFLIFYSTIILKITREGCLMIDSPKEQERDKLRRTIGK